MPGGAIIRPDWCGWSVDLASVAVFVDPDLVTVYAGNEVTYDSTSGQFTVLSSDLTLAGTTLNLYVVGSLDNAE